MLAFELFVSNAVFLHCTDTQDFLKRKGAVWSLERESFQEQSVILRRLRGYKICVAIARRLSLTTRFPARPLSWYEVMRFEVASVGRDLADNDVDRQTDAIAMCEVGTPQTWLRMFRGS